MSWAFVPSLIGCMLLMFGVVNIFEGNVSRGAVLLGLGAVFMAIFVWMMKREGRG